MAVDVTRLLHRTIGCGEVTAADANARREVVLTGWVHRRRDLGGLVFVDLRDREGLVQVVVNPEGSADAHAKADEIRVEYVLSVRGVVRRRPAGTGSSRPGTASASSPRDSRQRPRSLPDCIAARK